MELLNLIGSIGGIGGIAAIAYLWTTYNSKKSNERGIVHDVMQKIGIGKVEEANQKQESVLKDIEKSELLSKETKEKIVEIKKDANKKIVEILKTENFEELSKKEDELW